MNLDLSTQYMGLRLSNPLVVSSCPLTGNLEKLQALEQWGAAAVVLPSLFEEAIEHEEIQLARLYDYQSDCAAESLSYFPEMLHYHSGVEAYLNHLRQAKKSLKIPVIASLNGVTPGGWTSYARRLEEAGADALELNIYFVPTDVKMPAEEIERRYCELVAMVRESIRIPLAVKIGPFFTNIGHMARRLVEAGANGLVLFNRYLEPDIDIFELHFEPKLELSDSSELRLPLRWIAILRDQLDVSLAATSGVHSAHDVAKALLVGADATMMAAALLQHGSAHLATVLDGLQQWMQEMEYASVTQFKGSMSRQKGGNTSALERANYTKALVSFTESW